MAVIYTSIFTVIKRFPDHTNQIKYLYKENDNFQSMCEDYHKCQEACLYWNESGAKEAPERRQEYAMLRGELETEIRQSVAESNTL